MLTQQTRHLFFAIAICSAAQCLAISSKPTVLTNKASCIKNPTVDTDNGKVEGIYEKTVNNRSYSSFYCIPYGAPLIRFQPPVPAKKWSGTLIANASVQCPNYLGQYLGQEDCLCLNVFVPTSVLKQNNVKVPVVVDIHSGAFMFGYGNSYTGPDYLLDRDVVFISINYRLGALGFLSTEDDVIPGNMGLKDQALALKWINDNVSKFSGNPNDVTIMGLSAGGASISYHYLSKTTRKLYKAGVSMSGSPLNPWGLQEKPFEKAIDLVQKLGFTNCQSSTEIKNFLNQKTAYEITTTVYNQQYIWLGLPFSPYAPVIEKNCTNAFICKHPLKILQNKQAYKAPIIYAMTEDEGLYPSAEWLNDDTTLDYLEEKWSILCPAIFDFIITLDADQQVKVCKDIKTVYLNNNKVSLSTFHNLTNALSHRMFTLGIEQNAKLHAKFNNKVYVYRYNYYSVKQPSFAKFFSTAPRQGICHGDDVMMLFSQFHRGWPRFTMDPADKHVQSVLWDFILSLKTGSPSTSEISTVWTPMNTSGNLNYLYFGNNTIEMREATTLSQESFWESIPFEENKNII